MTSSAATGLGAALAGIKLPILSLLEIQLRGVVGAESSAADNFIRILGHNLQFPNLSNLTLVAADRCSDGSVTFSTRVTAARKYGWGLRQLSKALRGYRCDLVYRQIAFRSCMLSRASLTNPLQ